MIDESMGTRSNEQPVRADEFRAKAPHGSRFLVMIAGVATNLVLAVGIYIGICYAWGDTYFANDEARWATNFNEAGLRLGLANGDRLLTIDGEPVTTCGRSVNACILAEDGTAASPDARRPRPSNSSVPSDSLIALRQSKGYDGLLRPRMPFPDRQRRGADRLSAAGRRQITGIRFRRGADTGDLDFRDLQKPRLQGSTRRHGASHRATRRRRTPHRDLPCRTRARSALLTRNPLHLERTKEIPLSSKPFRPDSARQAT